MDKKTNRIRRARKARANIRRQGTHRLAVHRTPRHIYAQVWDTVANKVVAAASTLEKAVVAEIEGYTGNVQAASIVGRMVAERAVAAGIAEVAFDRSGFRYHGRVKALADGARAGGLKF